MQTTAAPITAAPISAPPKDAYWPQLDGLRTVAFLLVLIHHLGPVTQSNSPTLPLHLWLVNSISSWGNSGVDLFFCLSGFLISYLLLAEKSQFGNISFKLFFARRALRIWPVYYFLLAAAFVALPLSQWSRLNHSLYFEFCLKQLLPMVFFLGNYSLIIATKVLINFNTNVGLPVIYFLLPLWSLAVEEQFYLTWPFVLKALKSARGVFLTIGALTLFSVTARGALWYVSRYIWHLPFPVALYYQSTPSHLDSLMAGAFAAATVFYFPEKLKKAAPFTPAMMLGVAAIVATIFCYFPDIKYNTYYNIAVYSLIALAALLTLFTTLISPTVARFFAWGPMAKFGRLTYAMYLVHYFAIATADLWIRGLSLQGLSEGSTWAIRFAASLALTFSFAFVSWHLLERPVQRLRHNFIRHKQSV